MSGQKLVRFDVMKNRIREWRRQFIANQVVETGRKLRSLKASRRGVDGAVWPHDAEFLDNVIERLEQRHTRLLAKLKS